MLLRRQHSSHAPGTSQLLRRYVISANFVSVTEYIVAIRACWSWTISFSSNSSSCRHAATCDTHHASALAITLRKLIAGDARCTRQGTCKHQGIAPPDLWCCPCITSRTRRTTTETLVSLFFRIYVFARRGPTVSSFPITTHFLSPSAVVCLPCSFVLVSSVLVTGFVHSSTTRVLHFVPLSDCLWQQAWTMGLWRDASSPSFSVCPFFVILAGTDKVSSMTTTTTRQQ